MPIGFGQDFPSLMYICKPQQLGSNGNVNGSLGYKPDPYDCDQIIPQYGSCKLINKSCPLTTGKRFPIDENSFKVCDEYGTEAIVTRHEIPGSGMVR